MSRQEGVARYDDVDGDYLEKRRLRKGAGWKLLWALGVGAVISGDYYGWNFGLAAGGFWGLAIATFLMAAMYVCMVFSIAELSAALPHAGGFYSFVRHALGPTGGFVCGVTDTIEYVVTPAVIVVGIGGYVNDLLADRIPFAIHPFWWWFLFYVVFVGINVRGVELTLRFGLFVTTCAIAVLVVFYVGALARGAFRTELLFNIEPVEGQSASWLPFGWFGVFASVPFAIWFYLAIEQLPLAAEETHDVVRDMPRALILGIATLVLLSFCTLVINSGVGGGAAAIGSAEAPLQDGLRAVFTSEAAIAVLTVVGISGLVASFHTIIYAYARVLFALSRAGYFPRWISLVNREHTPHVALVLGAAIGLLCAVVLGFSESGGGVGAALLNMAVFGAVISYFLVMLSYIVLRIRRPQLARPYKSPLGVPGAACGAALSLFALAATFAREDFRPGVWGVVAFLLVAIVYFVVYSRHRLVAQAPEEEAALIERAEDELAHR